MPVRSDTAEGPPPEHHSSPSNRPGSWIAVFGKGASSTRRSCEGEVTFERSLGGGWPGSLGVAAEQGEPLPSIAERGPVIVVFEGMLYEHEELARHARWNADAAETEAALVLAAYTALGIQVLSLIRGVFALLIWDSRSRAAICARDPLGVYPLYHAHASGKLLVSPAIDLLLAQDGVSRDPNRLSLAGFIVDLAPRPEETFFSAIKRVPPGHYVELGATPRPATRFWHLESQPREPVADAEDALRQFESLLRQAVRRSVEFGRAAIWLSGGVDSAAVATAAVSEARAAGAALPWALSLVFPDPACNEEHFQRSLAAGLGLPQLIGPLDGFVPREGLLLSTLEMSRQSCLPPQSFWQIPYDRIALAGKDLGCKVVLSGDGGDEWLQPPPLYAADRLLRLDLKGLNTLRRGWEEYYPLSRTQSFRSALWLYGARPLLRATAAAAIRELRPEALGGYRRKRLEASLPDWFAPDATLRSQVVERALEDAEPPTPRGVFESSRETRRSHAWITYALETAFERSRRLGIRILNPLLDANLVAFLDNLTPELVNVGGRAKGLARELTVRATPELPIGWPRKVHAEAFWSSTMRREGPQAWGSIGSAAELARLGVVDEAKFAAEAEGAFGQSNAPSEPLWEVLSLERWLRID
jgi:asparagine synthetase B (glutamine-hydrolysing)